MMRREKVAIERGCPDNGPGLPRPLARHQGTLRPVPWTNADSGWGILHHDRAMSCESNSLCLVCGEHVEEGYIFAKDSSAPILTHLEDLDLHASDHGPLHARCARLTVAHCARIRSDLLKGETFMTPYCRQNPLCNPMPSERLHP